MLEKKLHYFLRNQEFVTVGTVNARGKPHASPKILLKHQGKYLYLIDYLVGKTCRNIKHDSSVCVTTFDIQKIKGFHVYGKAQVLPKGKEYDALMDIWNKRQNKLAAMKVAESVAGKKNMRSLKLTFLKPVKVYKIKISSINMISTKGILVAEQL